MAAVLLLACLSAAALGYVSARGYTLYYGDAEAHLNIARRVFDSRTPGWDQLGTPWLPLPHLLMLPMVRYDEWWRSGLAGAVLSAVAFVFAGAFLFAAARRIVHSAAAAWVALAVFALNPNVLYLQSIPMNEMLFFASLMGVLYFTVLFRDTQSLWAAAGAGAAALAGTLTRYEGWFVLPFVAGYFVLAGRRNRVAAALVFSVIAALGPLAWLAHNRWYWGDALAFYTGPYSARAIQGNKPYPGFGDWSKAVLYFSTAARWCAGAPLLWLGLAGTIAALARGAIWPVALLALPPAFYVWSMHSSLGTPIFVPDLWPNSYYNSRYGLALLPLCALGVAALATFVPRRWCVAGALSLILAAISPWLIHPREDACITWKESQVNSVARGEWTRRIAGFMRRYYRPGSGIFTTFGDRTAVFRQAGIPLRETLTWDNGPAWYGAVARPDLMLFEEWAIAEGGDPVQTSINRALRRGPHYELVDTVIVKGAPVFEIYRRALTSEP